MDAKEERAYAMGRRAAWRSILGECLYHLGVEDVVAMQARWITERCDAVAALRLLCDEFGDNDWPDDLHLADVIAKHLGDHLAR